ncbi:MAG: hypothetical protein PHS41_05445 [Victivallaceae bacterium]|nr:hypothetical protein [Victivallaceae bacterium]
MAIEFHRDAMMCNAAQVVSECLGTVWPSAESFNGGNAPGGICGALAAALRVLPDEAKREAVRREFIKRTGTASCAVLRGVRCEHCVILAAELTKSYCKKNTDRNMLRVLLIGDSIRMLYQDAVRRELEGEFEVVAPAENCRFAKFALNELDRWFAECGEVDIIHWNVGLWDSAVVCQEDGIFTPPEEYLRYLALLLREFRKRAKRVIFASTTPVLPGSLNQREEFVESLNAVAVPYMRAEGVAVNDLFGFVAPHKSEWIGGDCTHLNAAGVAAVGRMVADAIRKAKEAL